jgi:hypothetical protein
MCDRFLEQWKFYLTAIIQQTSSNVNGILWFLICGWLRDFWFYNRMGGRGVGTTYNETLVKELVTYWTIWYSTSTGMHQLIPSLMTYLVAMCCCRVELRSGNKNHIFLQKYTTPSIYATNAFQRIYNINQNWFSHQNHIIMKARVPDDRELNFLVYY